MEYAFYLLIFVLFLLSFMQNYIILNKRLNIFNLYMRQTNKKIKNLEYENYFLRNYINLKIDILYDYIYDVYIELGGKSYEINEEDFNEEYF